MRSETPDIAIELSLQPWRAFKTDGVIFFSDILTPLPALGIEFDVIKGKGPRIEQPIRSMEQVQALRPLDDPSSSLPFIHEILSTLRKEIDDETTLLGFVGTPWTLAAYAMEGKADWTNKPLQPPGLGRTGIMEMAVTMVEARKRKQAAAAAAAGSSKSNGSVSAAVPAKQEAAV